MARITKKVITVKAIEPIVVEEVKAAEPKEKPVKAKKEKSVKAKKESDEEPAEDEVKKEKKHRKPSAYNIMIGEFMKKIAIDEKEKSEDDKIPKGGRMKRAQEMYREWKVAHPVVV
jgi:cell division septation protein DedD